MSIATTAVIFFSVLFPTKTWYTPSQPLEFVVKPDGAPVTLVLTDFAGKPFDAKAPLEIAAETKVNLRDSYATLDTPGTYILYAVPTGKDMKQFIGTPVVIGVRADSRRGAAQATPMVIKVEPLRYVVMSTDKGDMTMAFYYDVAPNTIASFLSLAEGGYFDGLAFHRIVPNFVIQGGDPIGDSSGGPGYQVGGEFSDRQHDIGVLSMARQGDDIEKQGAMPRPEFANSAGSQFFICLKRETTKQLDRRYTVFGKVVKGLDVVEAIGTTPVGEGDRPTERREMKSVKVLPVTAADNPYDSLLAVTEDKK